MSQRLARDVVKRTKAVELVGLPYGHVPIVLAVQSAIEVLVVVVRVEPVRDFVTILHAVTVGIGRGRVGAVDVDLGAVVDSVVVGIGIIRVGAERRLLRVGQAGNFGPV